MATFGKIEEFDLGMKTGRNTSRGWSFFYANSIGKDADKKHVVLLTNIGTATYKPLRSLLSPSKLGEKS